MKNTDCGVFKVCRIQRRDKSREIGFSIYGIGRLEMMTSHMQMQLKKMCDG
jgi:hypothetical protein